MTDIDISEYLFYFQENNRKMMEKVFTGIKFEKMLLSRNDQTGAEATEELPFDHTKLNLEKDQEKIIQFMHAYLKKFCDLELSKFGVTKSEAMARTRAHFQSKTEKIMGHTYRLRTYLLDLEAAFDVFETQEKLTKSKSRVER